MSNGRSIKLTDTDTQYGIGHTAPHKDGNSSSKLHLMQEQNEKSNASTTSCATRIQANLYKMRNQMQALVHHNIDRWAHSS